MNKQPFSIRKRLKSFCYALNGLKLLLSEEHNARIHLFSATVAITFAFMLKISLMEWIILAFCVALVFITETVNTAIERLADVVAPGFHPVIGIIKDLSAAGVLLSALLSVIIGGLLFIPKIAKLIQHVISTHF